MRTSDGLVENKRAIALLGDKKAIDDFTFFRKLHPNVRTQMLWQDYSPLSVVQNVVCQASPLKH
jgi:hypothetical protein